MSVSIERGEAFQIKSIAVSPYEFPDLLTGVRERKGDGKEREDRAKRYPAAEVNQGGKYASFVFQSLPGEPSGRGWRAFTTGNCCGRMHSTALCCSPREREREKDRATEPVHRGNTGGKMIARLLLLVLFLRVPFIAYQFSLLFPYAHLTRPLVPVRCLGQFLFRSRADGSNSRRESPASPRQDHTSTPDIHKQNAPPGRSTSMHFPRSLLLTSPFFFSFYFPLLSIYYFLSFFFSSFGTYFSVRI